jgi:hypothetical protein
VQRALEHPDDTGIGCRSGFENRCRRVRFGELLDDAAAVPAPE